MHDDRIHELIVSSSRGRPRAASTPPPSSSTTSRSGIRTAPRRCAPLVLRPLRQEVLRTARPERRRQILDDGHARPPGPADRRPRDHRRADVVEAPRHVRRRSASPCRRSASTNSPPGTELWSSTAGSMVSRVARRHARRPAARAGRHRRRRPPAMGEYSGGMKRRVDLLRRLSTCAVLFLDERRRARPARPGRDLERTRPAQRELAMTIP